MIKQEIRLNKLGHDRGFLPQRFPDPIAGLFSYQTWNGMDGFWQNGVAIETMTNFMAYGNNTRYASVVKVSVHYT